MIAAWCVPIRWSFGLLVLVFSLSSPQRKVLSKSESSVLRQMSLSFGCFATLQSKLGAAPAVEMIVAAATKVRKPQSQLGSVHKQSLMARHLPEPPPDYLTLPGCVAPRRLGLIDLYQIPICSRRDRIGGQTGLI
jgi:hypothetical protein